MQPPPPLREQIESGEYFRRARAVYVTQYVDPIAERYFYLLLSALAGAFLLFTVVIYFQLMPLRTPAPFIYYTADIDNDLPAVRPLRAPGETPNEALKRYLVSEYIARREAYDIDQLEINARFVRAQSAEDQFTLWQRVMDPGNPESPISLYQRSAVRKIRVISFKEKAPGVADVTFEAAVESAGGRTVTRHAATVAFQYKDVTVDGETGEAGSLSFQVTGYETRNL